MRSVDLLPPTLPSFPRQGRGERGEGMTRAAKISPGCAKPSAKIPILFLFLLVVAAIIATAAVTSTGY